jgi:DNA ligase 4
MYGLKEKVLGKLLVKILQIDKNSEDGFALLNWKLPGQSAASRMAGDFGGRCFEVISKRPLLVEVGDMSIEEVNQLLDKLAAAPKEENQLPILKEFYQRMNAEELMWLIRIILRQMKVGATEKTFFDIWHPDAESLFNVSSSLRRVCWELHNPSIRLESEDRGVSLMQCFQPQLAQFQMHSLAKMVEKMRPSDEDPEFWIEEKLDGERMQLHMVTDESIPGGKRFGFWSRKAKDYTYLYGNGLQDETSALTRHLKTAFRDGVESVILDGEMITWDPELDRILPFGTLKTAALAEQRNPFAGGQRPLLRVFDILYLNGQPLTRYTLRDRRKALERSIVPVHRRLELHSYKVATKSDDIEPLLREVVLSASEGLVLKNPRSSYQLNTRNDDWMKVKPEYMTEFGESLDCLIIGGYYGSGKRGGWLSSFLCGLRVDEPADSCPQLFYSFCKVGGGLTLNDYATIRHRTEGKWNDYDPKNPPTEYLELSGGDLQYEKPDVWIKPEDSIVIEAKAASVARSDQFRTGFTLRFPRFKRLRSDKNWQAALSIQEFLNLRTRLEKEQKEKEFKIDDARRKRRKLDTRKKSISVAGYGAKEENGIKFEGFAREVFAGLTFYVLTESSKPTKKTKLELEAMIKANGGKIVQTHETVEHTVCIAERRTVKVASLEKKGTINIVNPTWLFDCIAQSSVEFARGLPELTLPLELERHLYFVVPEEKEKFKDNVDIYGDSYARDTNVDELRDLMQKMERVETLGEDDMSRLIENLGGGNGWLFHGTVIFFDPVRPEQGNGGSSQVYHDDRTLFEIERRLQAAITTAKFAGATESPGLNNNSTTHVVVHEKSDLKSIRRIISAKSRIPRLVTTGWIEESWKEKTLLDAERFAPSWI